MKKYFELKNENGVFIGVVENIPEDTTIETIKDRIETTTENETLLLTDRFDADEEFFKTIENPYNVEFSVDVDIILDWTSIDYEYEIDKNYMTLMDSLDSAKEEGLEVEVVYTALKSMKQDPQLSISEAIELGMKEWVK
jgi:hypothetical protein